MFKKILVPIDGSELSESVYPWLRYLVKRLEPTPEALLLRSFEPPSTIYLLPELSIPTSNALSDEYLGGLILEYLQKQEAQLNDISVDTRMTLGDPASEILSYSKDADLVIMASHGRGGLGAWLLGSVATKVIRGATVPTLVVGGRTLESERVIDGTISKILVAIDGSEASERAFETGSELARQLKAKLFLYSGVSQVELQHQLTLETNRKGVERIQDYLGELSSRAKDLDIECKVQETHGHSQIADYAEKCEAGLIVMGSHGTSGLKRWLVGSETERTLQQAHCPVLVTH